MLNVSSNLSSRVTLPKFRVLAIGVIGVIGAIAWLPWG
jgi:hypothetical protein